jgi:hypothetical protein
MAILYVLKGRVKDKKNKTKNEERSTYFINFTGPLGNQIVGDLKKKIQSAFA